MAPGSENVNFGIKVQTLKSFLDSNKIEYKDPSFSFFSKKKASTEIAENVSDATVFIGCFNPKSKKNNDIQSGTNLDLISESDEF